MNEFERQSASDREWLAFRYIAGELSGDEAAAFEVDLETSQAAREAVARAVDLSQAIALAESHQVELAASASRSTIRKTWIYGIGWGAAGIVAASVAGAIWWNLQGPKTGTSELADIWTANRGVIESVTILDEPVDAPQVLSATEPATAPAWMTAGVIGLGGGKLEDDADGDGKPDESWDDEVMEN